MTTDAHASREIDWYFDFVSPFAYLQRELLLRDHPDLRWNDCPVLLAGLLKHWGSKGPAEIPAKRWVTYQHCQWLAEQHNIRLRFPPVHPFNPLSALRLAIAGGCQRESVTGIFRALFADGADLNQPADWAQLCRTLGVSDSETLIAAPSVKDQLRANTERAAQHGLFGVPTLVIDERQFWGLDMTAMALEYLTNPGRFEGSEYRRLAELPSGLARKT